MKALLDTHTLLWWLADDRRLSKGAHELIREADVVISVVSLWEIEIKRGRIGFEVDTAEVMDRVARIQGLELLDVRPSHIVSLSALPPLHGDPFDRMLVAQARQERAALVSKDRSLSGYDVEVYW